jgi:hypothetical protein
MVAETNSESARELGLQLTAPLDLAEGSGSQMAVSGIFAGVGARLQPDQYGRSGNQWTRAFQIASAAAEVQQLGVEKIRLVEVGPFYGGIAFLAVLTPFLGLRCHEVASARVN